MFRFLSVLEGMDWTQIIHSPSARNFLLRFDEDGDDVALLEGSLEELREKEPREAKLPRDNYTSEEGRTGGGRSRTRLILGSGKADH